MTFQEQLDSGKWGTVYKQGVVKKAAANQPFGIVGTEWAHTDYGFLYTVPGVPGIYELAHSPK